MSKKPGLASAADSSTTGVTTLASRFEAPQTSEQQPSSKISDLASRFSNTSRIPTPSLPTSTSKSAPKTPVKSSQPISHPQNLSKRVSDLTRAFSSAPDSSAASTFTAAQSAFSKAASESKVSAVARKLDGTKGPTERVAGVARTFESMDTGNAAFVPRLEKADEGKSEMDSIDHKVDTFDVVASRFERGVGGDKLVEQEEEHVGKARERFLDAAKRFGG